MCGSGLGPDNVRILPIYSVASVAVPGLSAFQLRNTLGTMVSKWRFRQCLRILPRKPYSNRFGARLGVCDDHWSRDTVHDVDIGVPDLEGKEKRRRVARELGSCQS